MTIDTWNGTGTINLDGSTNLTINSIADGASAPNIAFNIDPDTTGVLPYKKLLVMGTRIDFSSVVEDFANKPVASIETDTQSTLFYAPKNYLYVDATIAGGKVNAFLGAAHTGFATVAAANAVDVADKKIFVYRGTFSDKVAVSFNGNVGQILGVTSTVDPESGIADGDVAFTSSVAGGFVDATAAGDTSLTINGGTFSKVVVGGDFVTKAEASITRADGTKLTINGGTFSQTVGGGMAYTAKDASGSVVLQSGDVNFAINGGSFARRVYGGSICNNGYGAKIKIDGDVNLTINSSANSVAFAENIVAGSFDIGYIVGSTNVTFKGSGSNLSFSGIVCGGSGATTISKTASGRVCQSYVGGSRNLVFDGFSGEFNGQIKAFQSLSFANGSTVEFTNSALNLCDIESWDFAADTVMAAADGIVNNFKGDTIALTGDWQDGATVAYGSEAFFYGIGNATVTGGTLAVVDNTDAGYESYAKKLVVTLA